MASQKIENGTAAEAYLTVMKDRGIDYLFANAGTDFAPLIEAMAKIEITGGSSPKPITVPHENVAVGMALGYYLVTGKPQLVMVHVNVGTANAICGVMNAWRGNVPILFSAGRTPYSEEGGLMGERSGEIHWPQEMRDQGAMLREFVKWDYELPNTQVIEPAIDRLQQARHGGDAELHRAGDQRRRNVGDDRHAREFGVDVASGEIAFLFRDEDREIVRGRRVAHDDLRGLCESRGSGEESGGEGGEFEQAGHGVPFVARESCSFRVARGARASISTRTSWAGGWPFS